MPTSNRTLLEKADLALADLITGGGYLRPAQAQKFMLLAVKESVLLPCGSRSASSTRLPLRARAAARLIAVVVLPTPPFWLAMAIFSPCIGLSPRPLWENAPGLHR